jgi:hypothetical protein
MQKLILMSLLIGTFWIPIAAAKKHLKGRRGVVVVRKRTAVFCVCYVIAVLYVLPRV